MNVKSDTNSTLNLQAAFRHSQVIVVDVQVCALRFRASSSTLTVRLKVFLAQTNRAEKNAAANTFAKFVFKKLCVLR